MATKNTQAMDIAAIVRAAVAEAMREKEAEIAALKAQISTGGKKDKDAVRERVCDWTGGNCPHCNRAFVIGAFTIVARTGYKAMCKKCLDDGKDWIVKPLKKREIMRNGVNCSECSHEIVPGMNAWYDALNRSYTCYTCKPPELKQPAAKVVTINKVRYTLTGKIREDGTPEMVRIQDTGTAF